MAKKGKLIKENKISYRREKNIIRIVSADATINDKELRNFFEKLDNDLTIIILKDAFVGCNSLERVELPMVQISPYSFVNCLKLRSLTFTGGAINTDSIINCPNVEVKYLGKSKNIKDKCRALNQNMVIDEKMSIEEYFNLYYEIMNDTFSLSDLSNRQIDVLAHIYNLEAQINSNSLSHDKKLVEKLNNELAKLEIENKRRMKIKLVEEHLEKCFKIKHKTNTEYEKIKSLIDYRDNLLIADSLDDMNDSILYEYIEEPQMLDSLDELNFIRFDEMDDYDLPF